MSGRSDPLISRRQRFQVLAHVRLLRVRDGQDRQVAVDHAEQNAVPVGRALEGAQI